ncbi:MAG: hypothetical protein ACYCVN_00435 [Acidimicrobiales bacterium]
MASNSTGRWVERAATTGGGRTYRGQAPVNWYATLVLICVVGLVLIGFSRYQRTHQSASSSGPPTTSQTWYAALGIDICGKMQPNLPPSTNATKTGLTANGNGVITVHPLNSSESGSNATLATFVSHYNGLELNATTIRYPGRRTYSNGEVCPRGTPDAGKTGVVLSVSWPSYTSRGKGTETSGNPQDLQFSNGQLITVAYLPTTSPVPKPPATAVSNLITAITSSSAPTTSAPSTPAPPTSTPTSAPTSSTVSPTPSTTQKSGGSAK